MRVESRRVRALETNPPERTMRLDVPREREGFRRKTEGTTLRDSRPNRSPPTDNVVRI